MGPRFVLPFGFGLPILQMGPRFVLTSRLGLPILRMGPRFVLPFGSGLSSPSASDSPSFGWVPGFTIFRLRQGYAGTGGVSLRDHLCGLRS